MGLLAAAIARALIDRFVDPSSRDAWWNVVQTIVVPALPAIGAWLGGLRAKRNVTPITADAVPRNRLGAPLMVRPSETRYARPPERPPEQERRARRSPGRPGE